MTTIHILGGDHAFVMPPAHAERHELVMCYSTNQVRGAAAILGLCVPSLWEPKAKGGGGLTMTFSHRSCGWDTGAFGARCWEELHKAGVEEVEFIGLAAPLFVELAARVFPSTAEVAERVGFSGASGDA